MFSNIYVIMYLFYNMIVVTVQILKWIEIYNVLWVANS